MPLLESKTIVKGTLELVISIPVDEMRPHLESAAEELQKNKVVAGFRPGKAPYEAVVKERGEMVIWEAAARFAVAAGYTDIMKQEHFETVGEPDFQVLKVSPAQPFQFGAKIALLPDVKIGDYKKIRIDSKKIEIDEKEVGQVVEELRDMRGSHTKVERPATEQDRVMVDLNMTLDNVAIEGGVAKGHAIDLYKPYFIEGFTKNILGLKAGEKKKFMLPFPKEHYDKNLAGKMVDFEVLINEVFEFKRPDIDDAFAKTVGPFQNVSELKQKLGENLKDMHQAREDQRVEREVIDAVIKKSTFGDIPEALIEAELQKIMWRLKSQVEKEGGDWNQYLTHLNKKPEELVAEWTPEAETRVKALFVIKKITEAEKIEAAPEEVEKERQAILDHYNKEEDTNVREEVMNPEYDAHLKHLIVTRKVMELLKKIATQ